MDVEGLTKYFPLHSSFLSRRKTEFVYAVDDISFKIYEGQVLGLVGESGCGKTTVARLVTRLIKPTKGQIFFRGESIFDLKGSALKAFRQKTQIVFQNPYLSLNPRKRIRSIVGDPIKLHRLVDGGDELQNRVAELLEIVGLSAEQVDRYPHEFSGGQRQRIAIARALGLKSEFLVLDEPTSSLDVSVQASILNDLKKFQRELRLTMLLISHNLGVIRYMSNRVAVMYLGRIVELAPADEFFGNPLHPYSELLLSVVPDPDPSVSVDLSLPKGELQSPINLLPICNFHSRCPYAFDRCEKEEPQLLEVGNDHFVACFARIR